VSDEHLSEPQLSKRERQKLRREQRKAAEQQAAHKARRRRLALTGLMVVVVLGLVGWALGSWWTDRQERQQLIAEAAGRLEELGCTDIEERPNFGAGHFGDLGQLAQNPPEAIYPERPTTSGLHMGNVALSGIYDKVIDERLLVHNLEHGYVNIFYTDDADPGQVDDLRTFGQAEIDGRHPKIIVSRWKAELPDDANFAFVAWDHRQTCRGFDRGVALNFLEELHGLSGSAPERTVAAHTDPRQQGAVDPNEVDGDLLFPPLGEGTGEELDPDPHDDDEAVDE
jgi:hypothetical protein